MGYLLFVMVRVFIIGGTPFSLLTQIMIRYPCWA